jgi:hypothetical protein
MIEPYLARLVWLSLAAFFLVHLAGGLAVCLGTPVVVRLVERLRPRLAARILLGMRLFPLALALFVVTALCVPSYLRLEPIDAAEGIGAVAIVAAGLGVAILLTGFHRGARNLLRSRRWLKDAAGSGIPVLAIAGFVRPRLVISPIIRSQLPVDELAAALRHEEAHRAAYDNCKRLVLALAPGLLPGFHGFIPLDRQWLRFSEWAADDEAVQGDNSRSLALASALVRVARLRAVPAPLVSSLLDGEGLAERVDRLMSPARPNPWDAQPAIVSAAAAATIIAFATSFALRPASLEWAHELMEHLIG